MRFLDLIYIDPALISDAYTELKGVSPTTKLQKTEDLASEFNTGIFRLGGTMRETREFAVSTTQMFLSIEEKLRSQPTLMAPEAFSCRSLFWTTGFLAVGKQSSSKNNKVEKELHIFTIANAQCDFEKYLELATKDEYFTSGYDRMAGEKDVLGYQIWEPIEALLRPAFSNRTQGWRMFTPIVMLKKETL